MAQEPFLHEDLNELSSYWRRVDLQTAKTAKPTMTIRTAWSIQPPEPAACANRPDVEIPEVICAPIQLVISKDGMWISIQKLAV